MELCVPTEAFLANSIQQQLRLKDSTQHFKGWCKLITYNNICWFLKTFNAMEETTIRDDNILIMQYIAAHRKTRYSINNSYIIDYTRVQNIRWFKFTRNT